MLIFSALRLKFVFCYSSCFLLFSIIAVSGLLKHGIKSVITARGLQKTARWFGFSFPITVMSEFFLSTTTRNHNYPVLHCGLVTSVAFILTPVFIIKLTCNSPLNTDHYYSYLLLLPFGLLLHLSLLLISSSVVHRTIQNSAVPNRSVFLSKTQLIPCFVCGN